MSHSEKCDITVLYENSGVLEVTVKKLILRLYILSYHPPAKKKKPKQN